ncbi:MAG: signal recognition particle-docking protein FtsY [Candidatus Marinimicrobia bacterium]|jgi:fused signal recognition particle receptor|nr:signal recognition particle-docking protein FtsY [Candidatus Neomarinimicrobiota bacterium]MBT3936030.1 signal recognition particle-docking protein FtsY [Candidatus Neomarinimicrobiota bacterium]MBT3960475.1 signal recognition particle-docking protein FtsY [Candidatus Neomarinimicrobiota bacterium]MBT4383727.1 signal recognition particle-docking protein FtsY [Candidatus Neomarinimicrobiota bacterium]MBT4636247.1 signal recognition particle-docking protein FtsY [Candidatus Neomarinimicrobiota
MLNKLFNALQKTRNSLTSAFNSVTGQSISAEAFDSLEEQLLASDLGLNMTDDILEMADTVKRSEFLQKVHQHIVRIVESVPMMPSFEKQTVIMIIGVNGTGKTTSAAKYANYLSQNGKKVLMVAADTYRAAAVEQLRVWANRIKLRLIFNEKTGEPSAVLFDGLTAAKKDNSDFIIVDTAGRLHTYDNLMIELKKMIKVVETRFSEYDLKTVLTIDATLGQNSLTQAREFAKIINIDGVILTKMDGTAKGGIVLPLAQELKIPIWFVGTGEDVSDFVRFDPEEYVTGLLGDDSD